MILDYIHSIMDSYLMKRLKETSLTKFRLHTAMQPILTIYFSHCNTILITVAQGINYVTFMYRHSPLPTVLEKLFPAAFNYQGRTLPSVQELMAD